MLYDMTKLRDEVNNIRAEGNRLLQRGDREAASKLYAFSNRLTAVLNQFEFDEARELREHCERAAEIVRTWPAWKQNILRDSSRAQWDEPRKPVT